MGLRLRRRIKRQMRLALKRRSSSPLNKYSKTQNVRKKPLRFAHKYNQSKRYDWGVVGDSPVIEAVGAVGLTQGREAPPHKRKRIRPKGAPPSPSFIAKTDCVERPDATKAANTKNTNKSGGAKQRQFKLWCDRKRHRKRR
jgi:hypothetical protein